MGRVSDILTQLQACSSPERAKITKRFFKTGSGSYSEGDEFIGVRVPVLRTLAKTCLDCSIQQVSTILQSRIHEQRHLALLIWTYQYKANKSTPTIQQKIYEAYIAHSAWINNWDLVDTSTPHIMGEHLLHRDRAILHQWVQSDSLWERRMSIVATWAFIKHHDFVDTLSISTKLLGDSEDLIHKAVGWMLREMGKRDLEPLYEFLDLHHTTMPRTMLRYSIEKLSTDKKTHYMNKP